MSRGTGSGSAPSHTYPARVFACSIAIWFDAGAPSLLLLPWPPLPHPKEGLKAGGFVRVRRHEPLLSAATNAVHKAVLREVLS